MSCLNCSEDFQPKWVNQKFCGRSCSASYNNRGVRRHGSPRGKCVNCDNKLEGSSKKYCSRSCHQSHERTQRVEQWLRTGYAQKLGSNPQHYIRSYIFEQQSGCCAICGMTNTWNGLELRFVLDHIDGDSSNNIRENLRLVCPNCDSQLPTFKSRNKGKGRHYRRQRYSEGKSY